LRADEELVDFTAHYYTSGDWGHFQIAGILRRVGFDSINTPDHDPQGHKIGWGVDLTGHAKLWEKDKLIGSVVFGQGIASYMNDGGTDLAADGIPARPAQVITPGPQGLFPPQTLLLPAAPATARAKAVPLLGVMAYLDHYWSDKWSSSIGYSFTRVDNTNLQDISAFREGEYASVNLLYTPASSILIGGEVMWGQRIDHDRASGDDVRFQISVKYNFSTKFNL